MEYDSTYYGGLEKAVSDEITRDEATIGDIETSLKLDFCEGCPLIDFPISEAFRIIEGTRAESGREGLEINVQYESVDRRLSDVIVLGYHDSNSIGAKRKAKIYEQAAKKTIECSEPEKVPKILGPLALTSKCPALKGRKSKNADFILR